MPLLMPNGTTHEAPRCNRCGAQAGAPVDPPLDVTVEALADAGFEYPVDPNVANPDDVVTFTSHGDLVDGRCMLCRVGARIKVDLRALSPQQQLAVFVLAGAWLDGDDDADSEDNVNLPVLEAAGPDVVQRLARGVLALGVEVGAVLHDGDCLTLTVNPLAGCTCRGGPGFLYHLLGLDLAMAGVEAAMTSMAIPPPPDGSAGD